MTWTRWRFCTTLKYLLLLTVLRQCAQLLPELDIGRVNPWVGSVQMLSLRSGSGLVGSDRLGQLQLVTLIKFKFDEFQSVCLSRTSINYHVLVV